MSYSAYFAIENKLKAKGAQVNRRDLIHSFTDGRTDSLRDLDNQEYADFITHMNAVLANYGKNVNEAEQRQYKKIIALFCKMGYTIGDKPDMVGIHSWCVRYGHLHLNLNGYHGPDLTKLVSQAQETYNTFIHGIYK